MKFLVLLLSDFNEFSSQKLFPSASGGLKSAFERSSEWARALEYEDAQKEVSVLECKGWNCGRLMQSVADRAKKSGADFVVLASGSAAFLDLPLSKKLIQDHVEYKAEYTFADGYPAGFAPEIIDSGAAAIMAELCKGASAVEAQKSLSKDSVFNVIKGDINSFEVETEIASVDYRLLRLNFLCDSKINLLSAAGLAQKLSAGAKQALLELDRQKIGEENVMEICKEAACEPCVLKSVPAFYNVQIEGRSFAKYEFSPLGASDERMDFERFKALVKKITDFSGQAVISLSLFGEAAAHPDFDKFVALALKSGHSVFVEVDSGFLQEFLQGAAYGNLRQGLLPEEKERLFMAVCVDAATQGAYEKFHDGDLQNAAAAIRSLAQEFPEVYPQFTRVVENESELEAFYRYWSAKDSPSGGKIIIQKYDSFCGLLPDKKTADLSPLVREPCWRLRRDFEILLDGSFLLCRESFRQALGNAFDSDFSELWKKKDLVLAEQAKKEFTGACANCDEWYTFNF